MNKLYYALAVLVGAFVLLAACTPATQPVAPPIPASPTPTATPTVKPIPKPTPIPKIDEKAVEKALRDFFAAYQEKDGNLMATLLTSDSDPQIVAGLMMARAFGLPFLLVSIDGIRPLDPNTAIITATVVHGSERGLNPLLLRKEEGQWKLYWPTAPATPTPSPIPRPPATPSPTQATSLGYSRTDPAPVGASLTVDFVFGGETYWVRITLQEVVRGQEAWARIQAANRFNDPPDPGFDYLLARIKIEYIKGPTPDTALDGALVLFKAVSSEGKQYPVQVNAPVTPSPNLSDLTLYPGATGEGWKTFMVSLNDSAPVMAFGRDYQGRGGVWFKLYRGT